VEPIHAKPSRTNSIICVIINCRWDATRWCRDIPGGRPSVKRCCWVGFCNLPDKTGQSLTMPRLITCVAGGCATEPLRSSRAARFSIIPTRDWLGPLRLPASTPVLAPGQLSELVTKHFARHDHALLIAELVRDSDGGWREINRGALVHRHWPKPGRR
jgi:hypothetical protein